MKIKVVSVSVQSSDARSLTEPLKKMGKELDLEYDIYCVNCEDADEDLLIYQELERKTRDADFVFIRCMADVSRFNKYEKYEKALKECNGFVFLNSGNLEVTMMHRDLFKGSDDDFILLRNFALNRGPENDHGLLRWAAVALGLTNLPVPAPVEQRSSGIYHPNFPKDVTADHYFKTLTPGKLKIGIMFTSSLWSYDNMDHIDSLIRCLESYGMNTIPIFFSATSFSVDGVEGTRSSVEKYFIKDENVIVDALIVCTPFSQLVNSRKIQGVGTKDSENYYHTLLDVPVIHAISVTGDYHDFEQDQIGLGKHDISANVAWPEIDGQIIAVPICYTPKKGGLKRAVPIQDRIEHMSRLAKGWATLRHKPISERKVAILLYQSRPNSGNIGGAAGLDAIESVSDLMKKMYDLGYHVEGVPDSGKELIDEILNGVTNDLDNISSENMRKKAADLVNSKEYKQQFSNIPEFDQIMTKKDWGEPPGTICIDGNEIVIPGLIKGNIFIGYQPLRGWADKMESNCHDPTLFAQHQYIAYYKWIRNTFKADLLMHIGTHGTLEWLPGKNVGLSEKCDPDLILDGLPNLYPYIIDDPGEGIQTKRRTESVVIGHMCPTMARAGVYEELDQVNIPLQEYFKSRNIASQDRKDVMISQIYEAAKEHDLLSDLGITEDPGSQGFEPYISKLHDYITEIKDALIRADLHVLGRSPKEHHMDETVYSLMRLDNSGIPSLRYSFAENMGIDLRKIIDDPSGTSNGEVNSIAIDRVDDKLQAFIIKMREMEYDRIKCLEEIQRRYNTVSEKLIESISYTCDTLVPNILRMTDEIDNIMLGLDGRYVLPGPSGAPTRGNASILPMGRNYYGLDPDTVPNHASWVIGSKMADQMIEHYVKEKGEYPREIGFILWATDTMKTGGDDISYILWLMGVKPIWSKEGGQVIDLEVISLEELERPRIDVTVHITGLFRDTFPNLIDLIDTAVKMVGDLDESEEDNALAANLRKDMIDGIANGLSPEEARKRNSVRVFGAPPGAYGTGVNKMIESSTWKTVNDLADMYIDWCSHGYAKGDYGMNLKDEFIKRFSKVSVTVKNMPDREIDLLDCDDVYEYLGGMNAFVRAYGKKDAISVMGDSSDPNRLKIRDTAEECKFVFRSKILNPKFMSGLKEHGYRGASELANITEYVMAWDATSDIVDDWMYEGMAEKFLFDEETQKWMQDVNIHAMMNILNRLQEAIERGLWNASDDMKNRIKDLYMKTEEKIEEVTDR